MDPDPRICAQYHCDKHSTKMVVEYAQLLSTAHRILDGTHSVIISSSNRKKQVWTLPDSRDAILYSCTHANHPSAIWVRENITNYEWLYQMWVCLMDEYTHRYGKIHATARLKDALCAEPDNIPGGKFFPPTPAMPAECKVLANVPVAGRKYDVLKSYRKYYIQEKASFAKWKNRNTPEWFATT